MLGTIGNLFILCGLLFSTLAIIKMLIAAEPLPLENVELTLKSKSSITEQLMQNLKTQNSRTMQTFSTFLIVLSMLTLIAGFALSDFSLQNVFINSSTITPLIYKVAASWSSHEGSMLFFITLLSIVSLYSDFKIKPSKIKAQANILQQLVIINLLLAIWLSANPFKLSTFSPHEGVGLNPVLQDIALAYHPPILYLGYAFLFIPFSYCLFIYQDKSNALNNMYPLLFFTRVAMMCLSAGIALGSWWAYRELGWGGFWFFDPVENISLLPWLCGIAFHHSMLSSIKKNMLKKWTVTFGCLVFPLPLLGIFLVRSNLLISVHSFALDASKAAFLGGISLTSFLIATYSIASYKVDAEKKIAFYSKEAGFLLANLFWIASIVSILASIAIPIFVHINYGMNLSLESDYFQITLLPILIGINIITAVYAYVQKNNTWWQKSIALVMTLTLSSGLIYYFQIKQLLANAAIVCSFALITSSIVEFFIKSNFMRQTLRFAQVAMLLGHISYGVLTLSIALNTSLEQEAEIIGPIGTTAKMGDFNISLQDIKYSHNENYLRQIAFVKISNSQNGNMLVLKPENRWYVIENKMTAESSIYSFLSYDLYAVLNRIDKDRAHVKIYYRPYISFIWLACIVMAFSFLISVFAVKKRALPES
jgi:cytochrome c-type biogenesis protein CcmF